MPFTPAGPDSSVSRRASLPGAEPRFCVFNRTRGTVLGDSIRRAATSAQRRKGLLGQDRLLAGGGLWIVPCEGVHSFGMRFAIDLVFVNRAGAVCRVVTNLRPCRISLCLRAHSVLEVPAGVIHATGTSAGDALDITSD